jgi:membrane associated rhomboid family serine protease
VIPLKDNIPTDRFPIVTIALIVANVVIYLLAIRHGGSLLNGPSAETSVKYGAIPYEFTHWGKHCGIATESFAQAVVCQGQPGVVGTPPPEPATWEKAFTSMFMHGGLLHIGGNMIFLWIFGNNVEDSMGRIRFIVFYVLGGLAALALQIATDPSSSEPTIGASGAIAAVLGAYILLYPRARVLTLVFIVFFFTIIELPALVMLLVWFALDALLPAIGQLGQVSSGAGVAYYAHIGGFVFGLLLIKAFAQRRKKIEPRFPVY